MTEPSPERPPVPDLAQILHEPVVTLLARADEVRLGDVIDTTDGLIRVREIVQRHQYWTLAGDPPGHVHRVAFKPVDDVAPTTRADFRRGLTIRVRRRVSSFGRLAGHSKRVASHNPVKQGCYTVVDGYDAACSCGWTSSAVHPSKPKAGDAWLAHKAGQLTEAAYAGNSALLLLDTTEVVHRQLPAVPWNFATIADGGRRGQGIAQADLSMLPVDQARAVLAAWQAVPGLVVDEDYSWDKYDDTIVHTLRGPLRRLADMRLTLDGERGERLILTAAYDQALPPGPDPWRDEPPHPDSSG